MHVKPNQYQMMGLVCFQVAGTTTGQSEACRGVQMTVTIRYQYHGPLDLPGGNLCTVTMSCNMSRKMLSRLSHDILTLKWREIEKKCVSGNKKKKVRVAKMC